MGHIRPYIDFRVFPTWCLCYCRESSSSWSHETHQNLTPLHLRCCARQHFECVICTKDNIAHALTKSFACDQHQFLCPVLFWKGGCIGRGRCGLCRPMNAVAAWSDISRAVRSASWASRHSSITSGSCVIMLIVWVIDLHDSGTLRSMVAAWVEVVIISPIFSSPSISRCHTSIHPLVSLVILFSLISNLSLVLCF